MTLDEAIDTAINCHKSGYLAEAEAIYREILKIAPENKVIQFLLSQVEGAKVAEEQGTPAEKKMLAAFKKHATPYVAVPPYNANWMLQDLAPIRPFLENNPLVVVDIGARGGSMEELENLVPHIQYYGFDADEEECRRINSTHKPNFHSHCMLPFFVGKDSEELDFYIYKDPGSSSRFLPNQRYGRLFGEHYEVVKKIKVNSKRLDDVIADRQIPAPDFIKLDTQGTELEILAASLTTLNKTLLVESEIELVEIYDGQPLLPEFLRFMFNNGFELLYLNRVFATRAGYSGPARGQITFCDALFARREAFWGNYSAEALGKHAILLANYGHRDIAWRIWNSRKDVQLLVPGLSTYFVSNDERTRLEEMNKDKYLYWQLHKKMTNQLDMDSDRSWPFR